MLEKAGLLLVLVLPPPLNGGMVPPAVGAGAYGVGAVAWPGYWLLRGLLPRFFRLRPRGGWYWGTATVAGGGTYAL